MNASVLLNHISQCVFTSVSFYVPRICVGTWNVGGKLPSEDLDIDEWLDIDNPADIYVLG